MLKRTGRSRRSERKSVDWEALREKVLRRDHFFAFMRQVGPPRSWEWWQQHGNPCVARFLDPAVDACEGRMTLDHVKDQLMMGRKAPDDEQHLVSLCWHHHLDVWATAHRPLLREYLRECYDSEPE